MEEKIINMLNTIINMQNEYQKRTENAIQSLKTDVEAIKTDIATLKTDVETIKADIATLKTDVETIKADIADLLGLKTDVRTLKEQRRIDTNNLALVLQQQTKMLKMLETLCGNTNEFNFAM